MKTSIFEKILITISYLICLAPLLTIIIMMFIPISDAGVEISYWSALTSKLGQQILETVKPTSWIIGLYHFWVKPLMYVLTAGGLFGVVSLTKWLIREKHEDKRAELKAKSKDIKDY